jgi:hypothetical protein
MTCGPFYKCPERFSVCAKNENMQIEENVPLTRMGNCLFKPTIHGIVNHKLYFYDCPSVLNISYSTLNGVLHGNHLLFNKNGKLLSKKVYLNGELNGLTTDYNVFIVEFGELVKIKKYEQMYENGILLSTNIIE